MCLRGLRRVSVPLALLLTLLSITVAQRAVALSLEATASGFYGRASTTGPFGPTSISPVMGVQGTSKTVTFSVDADRNDPPGFAYHAQAIGNGSVNFGVFSGKTSLFGLQAMPPSITTQFGEVINDGHADILGISFDSPIQR